jgi:protein O-mannosyl-transferase
LKIKNYKYLPHLLIVLVGATVFFNAIFNGFVWLDKQYIVDQAAANNFHIGQLMRGSALTGAGYYRPFSAIYFTLINIVFRNNPVFFHLIQVICHIANSLLIYSIFARIFKKPTALITAMVFLVHPLNESSVAFISNSAGVFCMFFGLLSLIVAIRMRPGLKKIALINFLVLNSLFYKETGVVFIFMILLFEYLFKRKNLAVYIISFLITTGFYLSFRYLMGGFQFYEIDLYPTMNQSLWERLLSAPMIMYFYIKNLILPYNIGINHRWVIETINPKNFFTPLLWDVSFLAFLIFCGGFIFRKHRKYFKIYLFFFLAFGFRSLGLIQIIPLDYTVAARWFYIPLFCILGMSGVVAERLIVSQRAKTAAIVISVIIIVVFGGRSMIKNTYWADDRTLFTYAAKIDDNFITEAWLANAYLEANDYRPAQEHIDRSTQMFAYDNNLAIKALVYETTGNTTEAGVFYDLADKSSSYSPNVHDDYTYRLLIQYYLRNQQPAKAKELLDQAVKEYPDDDYLWTILAVLNYQAGNRDLATYDIQKAIRLNPRQPLIQTIHDNIFNNQPFEFNIR